MKQLILTFLIASLTPFSGLAQTEEQAPKNDRFYNFGTYTNLMSLFHNYPSFQVGVSYSSNNRVSIQSSIGPVFDSGIYTLDGTRKEHKNGFHGRASLLYYFADNPMDNALYIGVGYTKTKASFSADYVYYRDDTNGGFYQNESIHHKTDIDQLLFKLGFRVWLFDIAYMEFGGCYGSNKVEITPNPSSHRNSLTQESFIEPNQTYPTRLSIEYKIGFILFQKDKKS